MTDLSALIARVEEGTEERALDAAIFIAFSDECQKADQVESLGGVVAWVASGGAIRVDRAVPCYTTSLDAVLSLIEQKLPGWKWSVMSFADQFKGNAWSDDLEVELYAFAPSPARALLAAALRALSALEDSKADLADATNGDRP